MSAKLVVGATQSMRTLMPEIVTEGMATLDGTSEGLIVTGSEIYP